MTITYTKGYLNKKPKKMLLSGKLNVYDITMYELNANYRNVGNFSIVFTHNGKSKILRYNN